MRRPSNTSVRVSEAAASAGPPGKPGAALLSPPPLGRTACSLPFTLAALMAMLPAQAARHDEMALPIACHAGGPWTERRSRRAARWSATTVRAGLCCAAFRFTFFSVARERCRCADGPCCCRRAPLAARTPGVCGARVSVHASLASLRPGPPHPIPPTLPASHHPSAGDYCDSFLTHDSPAVRKQHNSGYKHKSNVKAYYLQVGAND